MEARDGKLFVYSIGFNFKDDHASYNIRKAMTGPHDVGGTLWDVAGRRRSPPMPNLPKNVFKTTPGQPFEKP